MVLPMSGLAHFQQSPMLREIANYWLNDMTQQLTTPGNNLFRFSISSCFLAARDDSCFSTRASPKFVTTISNSLLISSIRFVADSTSTRIVSSASFCSLIALLLELKGPSQVCSGTSRYTRCILSISVIFSCFRSIHSLFSFANWLSHFCGARAHRKYLSVRCIPDLMHRERRTSEMTFRLLSA